MEIGNILIIDTETTGIDVSKNKCIEVAAILYNVGHRQMLQCASTLLPCDENPVEHINNIQPSLTQGSYALSFIFESIVSMAMNSSVIVAHNSSFDYRFLKALDLFAERFWLRPWLCTKNDFKWPTNPSRLRLKDICESLGIKYDNPHRALSDCRLLADCFSKVEDLKERLLAALNKNKNLP